MGSSSNSNSDTVDEYELIKLILDANNGEIVGSDSIQRLAYFADKTIDEISLSKFESYFFGPHNTDIAEAFDSLCSFGFVDETRIRGRPFSNLVYRLTSDGKTITDRIKLNHPDLYDKISSLVRTCSKHCNLKTESLSYAAKIHFMLENGYWEKPTYKDVAKYTADLDWDIKPEHVNAGQSLLSALNICDNSIIVGMK